MEACRIMKDERGYRRLSLALTILLGIAVGLLAILLVRYRALSQYAPLAEMAETIKTHYYYYDADGGEPALVDASLRGMASGIGDAYAQYYTKEEYDDLLTSQSGEYRGIGIVVTVPDETGAQITHVYDNSPMAEAGAQAGDYILEINDTVTAGLPMDDMLALFSTDENAADVLKLQHGDAVFTVTVQPRVVYVPYVHAKMLDGQIGYIRIDSFLGNVAGEMEEALKDLLTDGMRSLVLDLRNNPGGGLTEVLDVADMFLQKGDLIVSIKSKTTDTEKYYAEETGYSFPVAVLVNGNSASASELLSGALQDHERAVIIGTQTFGKGIVQTYFRLNSNAGWIKITTDAYYTPNDVCIHGIGITPDIVVELPEDVQSLAIESLSMEQDTQLMRALQYLKNS